MSQDLINPLKRLIKNAASTLPATTGRVAAQQAKLDRRQGETLILADISGSMSAPAWGDMTKLDVLRDAVKTVMQRQKCRLLVFSHRVRELQQIPDATETSTDLSAALRAAQQFDPGVTIVISDGQPDNPHQSLKIAETFRGAIDVLYVGPDNDASAISFMNQLARAAGGNMRVNDIGNADGAQKLLGCIAGLLPPPR